jgi:hypothetical protein
MLDYFVCYPQKGSSRPISESLGFLPNRLLSSISIEETSTSYYKPKIARKR